MGVRVGRARSDKPVLACLRSSACAHAFMLACCTLGGDTQGENPYSVG